MVWMLVRCGDNHVRPLRGRISTKRRRPQPQVTASPHLGLTKFNLFEVVRNHLYDL